MAIRLPQIKDTIESVLKAGRGYPDVPWLASYQGVSYDEAYNAVLEHYNTTNWGALALDRPPLPNKEAQPESIKSYTKSKGIGFFDKVVVRFISGIKSFVFLSASFGDLALTAFFYWSLGYDLPSKLIWGLWALTQTFGKLYLWHMGYKKGAVLAAVLSVIATVSIFLAVVDTQAIVAVANNTKVKSQTEITIDSKIELDHTLQERLKNTPTDYLRGANDINAAIRENNQELAQLRKQLNIESKEQETKKNQFELSAWIVFSQLTNFKWGDPSHIFALVLILCIAIFFEVLIYATTPRKGNS